MIKEVPKDAVLVSVIVPSLNEKEHVLKLIESLYSQTYRPIEVLFIDGGSIDGTRTLLRTAVKKYSSSSFRFILLKEEDFPGAKNPAHARNVCITVASGDYLVLLDVDTSFINCNSLSKLKRILDSYAFVGVKTEFQIDTAIEQQISLSYSQYCYCAYRKLIFNKLLFNERLGFGEDRDLWYRINRDLNVELHTSEEVLLCRHLPHTKTEYFDQAIWYAKSYPRFVENVLAEKEIIYINEIAETLLGCFLIEFPLIFFCFSVLKDLKTGGRYSAKFLIINFLWRYLFSFYLSLNSFNRKYLKNYVICLSMCLYRWKHTHR